MQEHNFIPLGFYFADGYYKNKNVIGFNVGSISVPIIEKILIFYLGNPKSFKIYTYNNHTQYYYSFYLNPDFIYLFEKYDLKITNKTKNWNGSIKFNTKQNIIDFLIGYTLGDGYVDEKLKKIEIFTYNRNIYDNIIYYLKKFKNFNDKSLTITEFKQKKGYRIYIFYTFILENLHFFKKSIDFLSQNLSYFYKIKKLNNIITELSSYKKLSYKSPLYKFYNYRYNTIYITNNNQKYKVKHANKYLFLNENYYHNLLKTL